MPVIPTTQSDRLFNFVAAAIPGAAAAYSASRLAPLHDWPTPVAIPLAGFLAFMMGLLVMRAATRRARPIAKPYSFSSDAAFSTEHLLETMWEEAVAADCELLLDQPLDDRIETLAELVLDDPLPVPKPDSRVVQLFAARPNAGELVNRIERHLGRTMPSPLPAPRDASDALRRALDELRHSLRQA